MNIEGRVLVERYRNGELLEERKNKNVVTRKLVEHITRYIWNRLAPSTSFDEQYGEVRENVYHPLRLGIGDENSLIIKALDATDLFKYTEFLEGRAGEGNHVVRITWNDTSTDEYTVNYLGLFLMTYEPRLGLEPIIGNNEAMAMTTIDPPIAKALTDTLSITWDIIFPFSELTYSGAGGGAGG